MTPMGRYGRKFGMRSLQGHSWGYDWAQEEEKVHRNEGAGAGGRLEEPKEEFILPIDPNHIVLDPRFDIDSVAWV